MIPHSSDPWAQVIRWLAEPALRALALAAVAGLGLAVWRGKDAGVRLAVWTATLYAALAMPFLACIAPEVRLPIPVFMTAPSAPAPAVAVHRIGAKVTTGPAIAARASATRLETTEAAVTRRAFPWPFAAVALYVLIAALLLAHLAVGLYGSRRIKLGSRTLEECNAREWLLGQAARRGLRTAPKLAESTAVSVPVTMGVWRPIILLPTAWRGWSAEKTQAVLAHELSHVVRRDPLTRLLAALYRCLFWFSPLPWWLERHLAALAEQASDDAALGTGADPISYAKVLLSFYEDLQSAPGRVRWEGVAMTQGKQAQQRMDRILDSNRRLSGRLGKPAWVALVLLAVPIICLLAGARPVAAQKLMKKNGQVLAAPAMKQGAQPLLAAIQSAAPAAPMAAATAHAAAASTAQESPWDSTGLGDVVLTKGQSLYSSGSFRDTDLDHIQALRRKSASDIIWFRRDGKAYIIRDDATIEQAKSIFAVEDSALDKKMQELERQQEALGAQQEELGRQMEQVRVPVPDLTAQLQKVQAQLDQLHKRGATQDELGNLQSALGDLQSKLGDIQSNAGEKQGELGGKQGELGAQQEKLGELQEAIGEQQARAAHEAMKKMKALIDGAIARGLAKPD